MRSNVPVWFLGGLVALVGCSLAAENPAPTAGTPEPSGRTEGGAPSAGPTATSSPSPPKRPEGTFPLVAPTVKAAAPAGLAAGGVATTDLPVTKADHLDAKEIRRRFFSPGPTNIFSILGAIDDRIRGLNARVSSDDPACLHAAPVEFQIEPLFQSVTLYAQCYESVGAADRDDPGFVQYGQKDGVTYYYSAVGAAWVAAILTPANVVTGDAGTREAGSGSGSDAGTASQGVYSVRAWSGVGYLNATSCGDKKAFDGCSYGLIQLQADAKKKTFEMSVAGIGFGYCGAQIKSDGHVVYGVGSADLGTSCGDASTFCAQANNIDASAVCGRAATQFELPALGRVMTPGPHAGGPGAPPGPGHYWAPSSYPGEADDTVRLDGTSSDSLRFGPTRPTPGVAPLR